MLFGLKEKPHYEFGINLKTNCKGELLVEICELAFIGNKCVEENLIKTMEPDEFEVFRERLEDVSKAISLIKDLHPEEETVFKPTKFQMEFQDDSKVQTA